MPVPYITKSYFIGELLVPNLVTTTAAGAANIADLQWFVDTYEAEFLKYLLGEDLSTKFIAGMALYDAAMVVYLAAVANATAKAALETAAQTAATDAQSLEDAAIQASTDADAAALAAKGQPDEAEKAQAAIDAQAAEELAISASDAADALLVAAHENSDTADAAVPIALAAVTAQQIWKDLKDKIYNTTSYKSPAAGYIYAFYRRSKKTITVDSSEVKASHENATGSESNMKMIVSWNRMVKDCEVIWTWLLDNLTTYPDFSDEFHNYLSMQNQWGI